MDVSVHYLMSGSLRKLQASPKMFRVLYSYATENHRAKAWAAVMGTALQGERAPICSR